MWLRTRTEMRTGASPAKLTMFTFGREGEWTLYDVINFHPNAENEYTLLFPRNAYQKMLCLHVSGQIYIQGLTFLRMYSIRQNEQKSKKYIR